MGTEPTKKICLHVDADRRFAAGIGGVAHFLADAGGLDTEAVRQLQEAVVSTCQAVFDTMPPDQPRLHVTLRRLSDRIEVELARPRELPGADPATASVKAAAPTGIDSLQTEAHGSTAVTRLTKFIKQGAPSR